MKQIINIIIIAHTTSMMQDKFDCCAHTLLGNNWVIIICYHKDLSPQRLLFFKANEIVKNMLRHLLVTDKCLLPL